MKKREGSAVRDQQEVSQILVTGGWIAGTPSNDRVALIGSIHQIYSFRIL